MRVIRFESIDSTNAEARRQASAGAAGGLWIVGGEQTRGRGRRARLWVSEPGNLYASLLLRPDRAVSDLGGYALVAAIALHDAAVEVAPQLAGRVQLKWPNDLVCDAGKVAGILLESEADAAGRPVLVIGWGVNCAHHPDATDYPSTDFSALGVPLAPETLFEALAGAFARWDEHWAGGGMAAIRDAWVARARGLGAPIAVRLAERTLTGIFSGLDDNGRLLLELPDGEMTRISAGDVFFPAPSGAGSHD